jgi:hypothetical protein
MEIFESDPLAIFIGNPINEEIDLENLNEEDWYFTTELLMNDGIKKLKESITPGRIINSRIVNMRISFIHLLAHLESLDVFVSDNKVFEWKQIDWLDGAPINANTLLLGLIFFDLNKKYFKFEKQKIAVETIRKYLAVWYIGWGSETCVNVQQIQKLKGKQFLLLKEPIELKGRIHKITPWKGTTDYGCLFKVFDHIIDKRRDSNCGIENSNWIDLMKCFEYERLTLSRRIELLINQKASAWNIPSILDIDSIENLKKEIDKFGTIKEFLKDRNLQDYSLGNEVMHIIGGHLKILYSLLCKDRNFNQKEAELKIAKR